MRYLFWYGVFTLLFIWAVPRTAAQSAAEQARIDAINTEDFPEIGLLMTLSDAQGRIVTDVTADAFSLQAGGEELSVVEVGAMPAEEVPVYVVLALDTSGSIDTQGLRQLQQTASQFISSLTPDDQVALVLFGTQHEVIHEFTADHGAVINSINELTADSLEEYTTLYNGTLQGVRLATEAPDEVRRAVLVVTDGANTVPEGSDSVDIDTVVRAASDGNVPIYAVGIGPEIAPEQLRLLATDGRFQQVDEPDQLEPALQNVVDQLNHQYQLRFRVEPFETDLSAPLRLQVNAPDQHLDTRIDIPAAGLLPEEPLVQWSFDEPLVLDEPTEMTVDILWREQPQSAQLLLDDEVVLSEDLTSSSWQFTWQPDSNDLSSGEHMLTVQVVDSEENEAQAEAQRVSLAPAVPPDPSSGADDEGTVDQAGTIDQDPGADQTSDPETEAVRPSLEVRVFENLAMDVRVDNRNQFFQGNAAGTYIVVDGEVYGHQAPASPLNSIDLSPVSQSGVTGTGSEDDPFRIETVARAGSTGLEITQVTTYLADSLAYQIDLTVRNTNSSQQSAQIFHAADLYVNFEGNREDFGYGFFDAQTNSVGARSRDGNSIQILTPITPADAYQEALFGRMWQQIDEAASGGSGFNNTINEEMYHDVAAGLQWNRDIPADGEVNISLAGGFGLQEFVLSDITYFTGGPGVPLWVWIVASVLMVLIALVIVAIVLLRSRRKPAEVAVAATEFHYEAPMPAPMPSTAPPSTVDVPPVRPTEVADPPARIAGVLLVEQGVSNTDHLKLSPDREHVIGRAPASQLVLESTRVSGTHARIRFMENGFVIVDMNSRNGLRVNGRRVQQLRLQHNDRVEIGDAVLVYKDMTT